MDTPFRIIMLVGLLGIIPIGLYHRIKANTDEKLDRQQEGWFVLLTLRPIALIRMIAMICWLCSPALLAWSAMPLPLAIRWFGVAVGVTAALLLVWTFVTLGTNITDTVVTRREAFLVTNGPYRWVRHPFYLAFGLGVTADTLATANWFLGITGLITFAVIVLRTKREEENLIARFGDEYRSYMTRSGRFLPFA